jgi:hypothetical protein
MVHVVLPGSPEETGRSQKLRPQTSIELIEALGVLARHVAFIQAGEREDRNRLALDLVRSDIDRVLASAGMTRRVDDRGDEWAELDASAVMWLGHRAELGRSTVRP